MKFNRALIKRIMLWTLAVIGGVIFFLLAFLFVGWPQKHPDTLYGLTWSTPYAEYLGLNSDEGLVAALDEFNLKYIRLPAYWNLIEPQRGVFNWTNLERQLDLVAAHGGKVTLCLGAKQPRWPEYWIPDWALAMSEADLEQAQLAYVETTFKHFADHPAIEAWQVESEPSFLRTFGIGKKQNEKFIRSEMQLVRRLENARASARSLASRPIYTSESGELSKWTRYGDEVDGLGTSVYRVVLTSYFGTWRYWFIPPWFYARKALLLKPWVKYVFVSEFQMEPWVTQGIAQTPLDEQFRTFDLKQMQDNFAFAERMPTDRLYFWGVEWWYWMKVKQNHPEFWETAQAFFQR